MSDDMTVEDFLKARCLSLAGEINSFGAKLENKLRQEFEDGKKELLSVHRQCVEGAEETEGVADMDCTEVVDKENDPQSASTRGRPSRSASTAASTTRSTRKKTQPTVHVLVEAGPHANLKAVLKPTKATASMVGRSTGKKFREKGLSLSKVRECISYGVSMEIVSGDQRTHFILQLLTPPLLSGPRGVHHSRKVPALE